MTFAASGRSVVLLPGFGLAAAAFGPPFADRPGWQRYEGLLLVCHGVRVRPARPDIWHGYRLSYQDDRTAFTRPVQISAGRDDLVGGYADQFRALERYPRGGFASVAGAGRYLPFERPICRSSARSAVRVAGRVCRADRRRARPMRHRCPAMSDRCVVASDHWWRRKVIIAPNV